METHPAIVMASKRFMARRYPHRADITRAPFEGLQQSGRRLRRDRHGYLDVMTPDMTPGPETNEEHGDTGNDDERPDGHAKDEDSPGATIDDEEPAEPNEPG